MDVGENAIEAWIREFSRSRFVPASVISSTVYERCRDLKGSDQRALTTAARKSCAAHLEARHWMRARVALLVRLSCSPDALARAERDGVLCAKNPLRESRQALLSLLERDSPADLATIHPDLHARISTYAALESLCARYRRRYIDYRRALRTRPPGLTLLRGLKP
jgi:hypothetical protein